MMLHAKAEGACHVRKMSRCRRTRHSAAHTPNDTRYATELTSTLCIAFIPGQCHSNDSKLSHASGVQCIFGASGWWLDAGCCWSLVPGIPRVCVCVFVCCRKVPRANASWDERMRTSRSSNIIPHCVSASLFFVSSRRGNPRRLRETQRAGAREVNDLRNSKPKRMPGVLPHPEKERATNVRITRRGNLHPNQMRVSFFVCVSFSACQIKNAQSRRPSDEIRMTLETHNHHCDKCGENGNGPK